MIGGAGLGEDEGGEGGKERLHPLLGEFDFEREEWDYGATTMRGMSED